MDVIYIHEIKVETIIGVEAWERQVKQLVCLDVDLYKDIQIAANEDMLEHTVDYVSLTEQVTHFVANAQYQLIESLACAVAQFILDNFAVLKVRVKVHKPGVVANARAIGIIVERPKVVS